MADLSVTYLGLPLRHPVIAGASPMSDTVPAARALEEGGAAAIVLRSLYEEQLRKEEMATHSAMAEPAESFPEALSYLPEPDEFVLGPQEYVELVGRVSGAVDIPVIASLNGTEPGPWLEYASMVEQAGADAIELNLYEVITDPAVDAGSVESRAETIVREIAARTSLPISVKLSPFYTSIPHIAARLRDAGARGVVLFNRFFEPDIDPEEIEVVPRLGLSTPVELLLRLRWLAILSGTVDRLDLAVTGGVHSDMGVIKSVMCGARAVQIVSEPLHFGAERFGDLRDQLDEWLDEHEYESVEQMRGSMDLRRCPNPRDHTRSQYVRLLQTWRMEGV
jgi:dihydroorotate dehydrogenase (fumarate)